MNARDREIIQSPIFQGEDEERDYAITTTPWGSAPTAVTVVMKDNNGVDVSATTLSGAAAVAGDVITLPTMLDLTAGEEYRLECLFTSGGEILEAWGRVIGQV